MNIEQYLEPLPLTGRLSNFIMTFFLNYILLLLFFSWLEEQFHLGLLFDYILLVVIVTAGLLSSIILFLSKNPSSLRIIIFSM